MILEFSHVQNPLLKQVYDQYSFNVIPKIGGIVANDSASYQYLVESIRKFPTQVRGRILGLFFVLCTLLGLGLFFVLCTYWGSSLCSVGLFFLLCALLGFFAVLCSGLTHCVL